MLSDSENPHDSRRRISPATASSSTCRTNYRPFIYTKSRWDFPLKYFGWNLTLCAFVGARVIRSFPRARIDRYAVGVIYLIGGWEERVEEARATFYAGLITARLPWQPEILWPVSGMTKRDILEFLPAEVLTMASFCRNPEEVGQGEFRPCGNCVSCNTRKAIGRFY